MGLTRDIDDDLLAAISAGGFHPVTLVFVDWPDDPVRVHSGSGTISWGGHDWIGLHEMNAGTVTLPDEAASLAMVEGTATAGGDPDLIDEILGDAEAARGRTVQVWFGATTERAGTVLIGDPMLCFTGGIGTVSDEDTADGDIDMVRLVSLQITSGPSQRSRAATHHSWDDQRRTDPDDTAGRWVSGAIGNLVASLPKW
ncbi:hypothetical protein [Pararhodobacter zhoushanensis]|uniref:hypothetical protein n=1 Tax=Pararhodobacter zhoushanensis TaxID=2479545 RepID=UPI000F8F4FEA|nr:hypothetical protein [Pararhodobacter zhoushanensis]